MSEDNKRKPPEPPKEIDFSKIANLEADKQFKKNVEKSKLIKKPSFGISKGKFDFREAELIPLPSRGLLYQNVTEDEDVLKGFIRMLPMTIREEEILSTPRFIKTGSATRMIIQNCIASAIDAKDLLLFDSNFLLFYLRKISYGDEYSFQLKCENRSCEQKFEHTVNITELKFEELPEDIKEPLVITLPKCGYTVETILPRLYHSEEIYMRNRNKIKSTEDEDTKYRDNLIITTISIKDPTGKEIPKSDWQDFFQSIIGIDAAELRQKTNFSTGVDKLTGLSCPYCEEEYSGVIPIGIEFFRF
jgi:hypothetical protein